MRSMDPADRAHDLTCLQLELECIGFDENGYLTRIPCDNPDDIARFFVVKYETSYATYFRADVEHDIIKRLQAFSAEHLFNDSNIVMSILYQRSLPQEPSRFVSYVFTQCPLSEEFSDVTQQDENFVVVYENKIVSRAWASRQNTRAAELAVQTDPNFRRRGYGRQVCSAWAAYQLGHNRIAFYSHLYNNAASRALAQNLGTVPFLDGINYP